MDERLSASVWLAGEPVQSATRVVSAAADVVVLSTTVACPAAPITLHSTYVGHRDGDTTAVTHLVLEPGTVGGELSQQRRSAQELPVGDEERRACLYDHLQELLATLNRAGHDASIEI